MERGRPLLFETPEILQKAVDEYFEQNKRWTLAGLAHYLGIDRQTLYNYKERPDYFDIIKKATEKVEATYEERLVYENNPTGVIFALKNMGWRDKVETGFTDNEGKDVPPVQIYLPDNGRTNTAAKREQE